MRRPRKRILLIALGAMLVAVVGYLSGLLVQAYRTLPSVVEKVQRLEEDGPLIQDLPPEWKAILLRVEDPGFYEHNGVDLSTPGAGMTTITQGLVKKHFFRSFEPGPLAKLRQTVAALVLDRGLEKDRQLTLLLHTAGFGSSGEGPVVGFPAAARAYFGRELPELSREQFINLVAMLVGPNAFHPTNAPAALADRVSRIETLLAGECEPAGLGDVYLEECSR